MNYPANKYSVVLVFFFSERRAHIIDNWIRSIVFSAFNVKDQQLEQLFLSELWNTLVESLFFIVQCTQPKISAKTGGAGQWVFDQGNPIIRLNILEQSEDTMCVCQAQLILLTPTAIIKI